jgi:hypothetical protein
MVRQRKKYPVRRLNISIRVYRNTAMEEAGVGARIPEEVSDNSLLGIMITGNGGCSFFTPISSAVRF